MKRVFLYLAMLLMGVLTFAQETITVSANSEDISQSLDLKVVAKLFAEASTTEQFEIALNNPDSAYSNLDLNGDNQIDYLRVVETGTSDNKLIVIQAVLAKDIYQDVASIYVEKDNKTQNVSVQIIGDEYIYGTNYIIEPIYIYRPVIYNWFWSPRWYCWHSPWYWGYYPNWWYYRPCYTYHWYYNRCYRFHHCHRYYCSFRYGHQAHYNYSSSRISVSRNDYAVSHPNNSFNKRNTDVKNANEFYKVGGASTRNSSSQQSYSNSPRVFNSKSNETIKHENTQRVQSNYQASTYKTQTPQSQRSTTTTVTTSTSTYTRRPTSQSGVSVTTRNHSYDNTYRQQISTQQKTNIEQVNKTPSSYRISENYNYSPSRSSSSSSTRSYNTYSSGTQTRSSGSVSRSPSNYSGGSSRSYSGTVSRSSSSGVSTRH